MIYITGDLHGDIDIAKLLDENFMQHVTADDYVIICGDFGLIWKTYEDETEKEWLDFLEEAPYTTLFIDGNHENFYRLYHDYPTVFINGGLAHQIRPSIYHLMRGQIFTIEHKTFFTMGGATSIDRFLRIEGKSWWARELPNETEYKQALINLMKHHNHVDYVLTHCLPTSLQSRLPKYTLPDDLTEFLDRISHTLHFKKWYCGHYHLDTTLEGRYRVLYNDIISIENEIYTDDIE